MKLVQAMAACILSVVTMATAQESGIHVRSIRVLATDPEAIATFYKKAFGMSETRRPASTATFKEIVINSGSTTEIAKTATTTPIVIATRPKNAPAGAMASLIAQV
jgi:predicted enzyme related to lactoylglutathione lyase